MAASASMCTAAETRVDYLKGAKLVSPRHSKSKVWCYFGFKEQGGDNEFVYFALCKMKLKYFWNTTNLLSHFKNQHALEYTRSELSKIKPSPPPSELSGVIGSTLGPGRWKLHCDPSQITLSDSLTLYCTHLASLYIFFETIFSERLGSCVWDLKSRWTEWVDNIELIAIAIT